MTGVPKLTVCPAATVGELTVALAGELAIVRFRAAEVRLAKFPSPLNCAVILWVPADNDDVVTVATPDVLRLPVPMLVDPSKNVMVSLVGGVGGPTVDEKV